MGHPPAPPLKGGVATGSDEEQNCDNGTKKLANKGETNLRITK